MKYGVLNQGNVESDGDFEQFSQTQLSMLLDEYFGGHGPEHQEAFQLQYSLYEALEQCWTLAIHSNFQPG